MLIKRTSQGGLALVVLAFLFLMLLDRLFPIPLPENNRETFAQVVVDRHGRPLRAFADHQGVWRYPTDVTQVSETYITALIGYEDRWFYYHPGINPIAILRATYQNIVCQCVISGGSTLSMQVARRFDPHSKSLSGKIKQALRALQLEWHYSKDEILNLYMNYAPMGGVIEGVEAASRAYLDKSAKDLSLAESALLAVLPQAPSRLRPDRHPERAQQARNKVLARLKKYQYISETEYQQALLEPLFAYRPQTPLLAPLLSRRLSHQFPDSSLIHSTLDWDMQYDIQDFILNEIQRFPDSHSAAVLVVENASHEVLAYLGSADFHNPQRLGHVDMVQAKRSPGSTLKPFIYGEALEAGVIHSASLLRDIPRRNKAYQPNNFSSSFSGPVTPHTALKQSLNLPAVQVLEVITPEKFYSRLANVGASYDLPHQAEPNLSLALGGGGSSLWKLAKLYSALANEGQVYPLKTHLMTDDQAESRWLHSAETAWVMGQLLRNPDPKQLKSTLINHKNAHVLAWKTGTSYGYRDAWAIGFAPKYTFAVWLGRPDGTPSPGHFGAISALPILFKLQQRLDPTPYWPEQPEAVSKKTICWPLGRLSSETPSDHCHFVHQAWVIRGQVPPTLKDLDQESISQNPMSIQVDGSNRMISSGCSVTEKSIRQIKVATWPAALEPWLPQRFHIRSLLPALNPECEQPAFLTEDLLISGIEDQQKILPLDNQVPSVQLNAQGGFGERYWYLNGRYVGVTQGRETIRIAIKTLGAQQITLIDEQSNTASLTFYLIER